MSVENIQINGVGTFNNSTENAGVVTYATFGDTATNSGTISVSAEFSLSAANHGIVTEVAVFMGDAVNTGTVAVAEFKDNAVNAGTVSTSAVFSDSTSNTGTVAAAQFVDTAKNDGGTVTGAASFADTAENIGSVGGNATFTDSAENKGSIAGDAIFADTTVNTGSVAGNAQVAATADNSGGTVNGNVTEYDPTPWYSDNSSLSRTVTLNGTVTQADEGGGILAAAFNGSGGTLTGGIADMSGLDMTIEFFAKLNSVSDGSVINIGTGTSQSGLNITFKDSGYLEISEASVGGVTTSVSYVSGRWDHYAVVFDGTDEFTIYKNGTLEDTITLSINQSGATSFFIGNYFGSAAAPLDGDIAGLRVVKGSMLYTSNFSTPTTLPTDVSGTELLLNFDATTAPTVNTPFGITSQNNNYYRHDGYGNFIQVYQFIDSLNNTLYSNNSVLSIGTIVYSDDGTLATAFTMDIADMQYITDNDGEIYSIVDTDPYN